MGLFTVLLKSVINSNGVKMSPGASVEIDDKFGNLFNTNEGRQKVFDAFKNKYGQDLSKTCVNKAWFDVTKK